MRNYVIINGVNSLTIQGLAINILPPITKPMIRTQIEEIDGRDGDLVTELGYSAYDKSMEIGLWGTYDIDAIIKYFTGEGTIVFSNEPDKFYNFKIINQIDYDKLLKFKKATVTLHCQPFKYPVEETPIQGETINVSGSGASLTLDNTVVAPMNVELKGNTYQDSTTGKNKFDLKGWLTTNNVSYTENSDGSITISATTSTYNNYFVFSDTDISVSLSGLITTGTATNPRLQLLNSSNTVVADLTTSTSKRENVSACKIRLNYSTSGTVTFKNIMLNTGTTAETYEEYTGGMPSPNPSYPQTIHTVSGDNSIEVCGKNLFDKNTLINGYFLNTSGNLEANSSYAVSQFINVIPGEQYYIPVRGTTRTKYYLKDKTAYSNTWDVSDFAQVITIPNNVYFIRITVAIAGSTQIDVNTFQFEKGNQATTYEEYKSATYPINLGVENLLQITNTSQTINGVEFRVNDDKSITINGTASANTNFTLLGNDGTATQVLLLKASTPYYNTTSMRLVYRLVGGGYGAINSGAITPNDDLSIRHVYLSITSGTTINNQTIYPQIIKGNTAKPYNQYGKYIELCKIGTYQDKIDKSTGKNLFDYTNSSQLLSGALFNDVSMKIVSDTNCNLSFIECEPNTTYTISRTNTTPIRFQVATTETTPQANTSLLSYVGPNTGSSITITTPSNAHYIVVRFIYNEVSSYETYAKTIQVELGNTATSYEPYGTSWYVKKEIGKVVLDGSESYSKSGASTESLFIGVLSTSLGNLKIDNCPCLSNYFSSNETWRVNNLWFYNNVLMLAFGMDATQITDVATFKTWLSTHNTEVYYVLATPTYETITDTNLIEQLEALKPYSYNPTTNITQTNNDAPFELDVSLSYTNTMNVNNVGNIYAKPILTIEGSGTIGIILNGIEILSVDLGTDEKITIDVPNLQAYDPDDNTLLNRLVTGDYMKLLIQEGDNTIAFSGSVTSATLTNYTRWI